MTFEKLLYDITFGKVTPQKAYEEISSKEKMKTINYYAHINEISKNPLKDNQLQELNAIVKILQMLYNSKIDSPVSDSTYDSLQESLVYMGIPRLSGSIEINNNKKVSHRFKNLRGTLDKVYYLFPNEVRTNKSRRYLDEWIKSTEALYKKNSGKDINLNDVKVIIQNKYDGISCIMEDHGDKPLWLTRGDTSNNTASDVSHIMSIFNDVYKNKNTGQQFEILVTEEGKDKINTLLTDQYKNSRQVVTSIMNSNEADFKVDYLYPVPLRIIHGDQDIPEVHPMLIEKFPTLICKLSDRDKIKEFANNHKYVKVGNERLRTDGIVITILDENIKRVLGRDNNINNFEVAYKFTEEYAYTRVKDVEFYVSDMSYITPVLVVNDVILKGNTINHISLSNKERFDELNLSYGDEVKVLYDIIPYVIVDDNCRKSNTKKIEFIKNCPICNSELDLDKVMVRCNNPECTSRKLGIVLNYCTTLKIQHIGYNTLQTLYDAGLLKHGIRSLYKLKKKADLIQDIEGFGLLKTKKIISEIEKKRKLFDYEFLGSIGIDNLSIKTFKLIFSNIKLIDFLKLIESKNFSLLNELIIKINGLGEAKSNILIDYFKNKDNRKEFFKTIEEIQLIPSYGKNENKEKIVFSGCRPNDELINYLNNTNYEATDSWNNSAKYLVIPTDNYTSSKVGKAKSKNIPIIALNNQSQIDVISKLL